MLTQIMIFLEILLITLYQVRSNDKPEQGYENSVLTAGIGTSFEQYRDIIASLGLSAI